MNDRVVVNHATIVKVNETWDKTLNELNCHLHPLDTGASCCRAALKSCETTKGELYGKECMAANIVVQMNKLRYKDGKGDPKGFKTFLDDHKLPRGILPRYRGNRLHILFHICGKLFEHHKLFLDFLINEPVSCGGLVASVRKDFCDKTAVIEMQVLGLIGKLLTGPWMKASQSIISHIDGIVIVKNVISALRETAVNPMHVLNRTTDFFGGVLFENDETIKSLRAEPLDTTAFLRMVSACLLATVSVLERQYQRYFELDITEQLRKETVSARSHNIDAEEVMGMFSAGKERAKNATTDFLVARMRGKKNKVVHWLDGMYPENKEKAVTWAIGHARNKRKLARKKISDVRQEMSKRAANKRQKKNEKQRKAIEKKLKNTDIRELKSVFPDISEDIHLALIDVLRGTVVGRSICHTWYDETTCDQTLYSGKIEKLKKRKGDVYCYTIAYWCGEEETYGDATDYDVPKLALAADLIFEDLILC
ncbi:hypothetical protein SNE40_013537 [Patella caerulea]|uniref:Uncharacterized protein n=1 Tax=Patella caerulea TaxID=87958 RepID=A0AAN8JIF7_PATCE